LLIIGTFAISLYRKTNQTTSAIAATATTTATATTAPIQSELAVNAETTSIYLPLITRNFSLVTIFGIEMTSITPAGGLDAVVQTEASWTRRNGVLWSSVEPAKGDREWAALSNLDTQLVNAASKGLEVILIVRSTPAWAQKFEGQYCGPIKKQEFDSFANFMYDLVTRYSQPPYNIKYWEIWNEPDIDVNVMKGTSGYGC
ncbi:MAG: hypothetical protein KJ638_04410, partial [Chloroflexi bacterium]|nr:hypothetical protein [Chloroflexota bacterium]